jgi:erythromycin esterase-like protein
MIKKLFLLLIINISTFSFSQELITTELLPPESEDISDLSFLKDELQGKNLVMLGEQTHMYVNIFEMKARVVEYLHQELGYTTIALEAPMYDVWKKTKGDFDKQDLNSALWYFWRESPEFQRLIEYIFEHDLKVIGFDSQINFTTQFIDDFFEFCEKEDITINLDQDDFGILVDDILVNYNVDETDIDFKSYEKEINKIIKQIEKLELNEINFYWAQFIKGLLAISKTAMQSEEILTMYFGDESYNIRDKQMADNLLNYISRYPDEKIVVWADNVHIINDNTSITEPIAKDFIPMGFYIKKELKDKSYSLATIHANDSLYDMGSNKWESTPIQPNSFEDKLRSFGKKYMFVSSNQKGMKEIQDTRLINYLDFTSARLDQFHDGYIFFDEAIISKSERIRRDDYEKRKKLIDENEQTQETERVVIKGQILDEKNQEPIPYTTIILKKEEIYRVADSEGFFELPVKKDLLSKSTAEISSMGFETKTILLEELTEKIYLKPKFEQLEEVVIKGYLSPKAVLKKAISKKKENYPTEPFNLHRYGKVLISKDDDTKLNLEYITKGYERSYLKQYGITERVEQIKWNKNESPKNYRITQDITVFRENPIRYSSVLHKRKYKKFKLEFERSNDQENKGRYIISFEAERDKFNFTGRNYPTKYFGKLFIDKESFAFVKVIENRETNLNEEEIDKYINKRRDKKSNSVYIIVKQEVISNYSRINNDGLYYPSKYHNRTLSESMNSSQNKYFTVNEKESIFFDYRFNNVEEIEYYGYNDKEENSLYRVEYDEDFWDEFYINEDK